LLIIYKSDRKMNKIFMNEADDNLQNNLFGEVKEMTLDTFFIYDANKIYIYFFKKIINFFKYI